MTDTKIKKKTGPAPDRKLDDTVMRLKQRGLSFGAIAKQIKRSRTVVFFRYHRALQAVDK